MVLSDIDVNLQLCENHLESTQSFGTEIESFLTQYLLVYICREYEIEIKNIVINRARRSGDKDLITYVENTVDIRSIRIGDIKGKILNRFNDYYKDKFHSKIDTESKSRYSNIILNRNEVAHGNPVNITIKELVVSHNFAKKVLKAFSDCFN